MSKSVVSDFQGCSFKGFELGRFLVDWKDTREPALVVHRYLKRDGGEVEVLGRKPHEVKATLAFIGPSWRKDWLPIAASIDDDPKGPLVHPVYGPMQATCQGFNSASMNVSDAANLYMVPLGFVEDNVDTKIDSQATPGPPALAETVAATGAALLQRSPSTGSVYSSVLRFVTMASSFASATFAAFAAGSIDLGQPAGLATVALYAADARTALRLAGDAASYDAVALAEQLYDGCVQLADAVQATGPRMVVYTVPALTSLAALAARFYGADGLSRMNQILANNRGRLPNPAAITAGTALVLAAATTNFG